jgi:glycosyltransferase involved in cell wall biosynthesis
MLLRRRYDAVHAHEEAVFWCRWLKPVFRFKLIHDMHSSLPQQLENFQFTKLRILHWLFEVLERSAARAAEAVIVVCPALEDYAKRLTTDHEKIFLIENSLFDPVVFAGGDAEAPVSDDQLEAVRSADGWLDARRREHVITYAGTLEVYQGIDRLLEAFSVVIRQLPDAGLLIIGGSVQEVQACQAFAGEIGLRDTVHFTGQLPQADAQRLVAQGGASISPRFAGNNTPMKIYKLMADGIPLVATRIESHTQVLNDEIAILSGVSTGALADAIFKALRDRDGAHRMAARAKAWYEQHYARGAYVAKMRKLFTLVS